MNNLDGQQLQPLLEHVLAGESQAYNDLFTLLRPYLHGLVRRCLGPDAHGPVDYSGIVQSSLRRIYENLDAIGNEPTAKHFLAWVKKIVRNRAIDEVRRRAREMARQGGSNIDDIP